MKIGFNSVGSVFLSALWRVTRSSSKYASIVCVSLSALLHHNVEVHTAGSSALTIFHRSITTGNKVFVVIFLLKTPRNLEGKTSSLVSYRRTASSTDESCLAATKSGIVSTTLRIVAKDCVTIEAFLPVLVVDKLVSMIA